MIVIQEKSKNNNSKISEKDLFEFIKKSDKNFPVPLSERVNLREYTKKLYNNATIVAKLYDNKITGAVIGYTNDTITKSAYCTYVNVDNQYRRRGMAKELLLKFMEYCKSHGLKEVKCHTSVENNGAIKLYESNGFKRIDMENGRIEYACKLEKFSSNVFVTPIMKCNLQLNNNQYYIKRDDLYPVAWGGNKARIAEALLKDAIGKGCNHIISYGSITSNMNRAVANLCSINGIKCTLICCIEENLREKTNNSVLSETCGATIVECNKSNVAVTVKSTMKAIENNGEKPYYIYGDIYGKGNEKVTTYVYANVYKEIISQERNIGVRFDYIFLATGTGMTQSGLIIGNENNENKHKIVGVSVARKKDIVKSVLIEKMEKAQGYRDITNKQIEVYDSMLGDGYGQYDKRIMDVIVEEIKKDGVPLDITYTGKAFLGMEQYIKEHQIEYKNILFLHTGGTPLFWDDINKFM